MALWGEGVRKRLPHPPGSSLSSKCPEVMPRTVTITEGSCSWELRSESSRKGRLEEETRSGEGKLP